jgi:hypothetical protein
VTQATYKQKSDQDAIYINKKKFISKLSRFNVSTLKDEAKFKGYKKPYVHN